MKLDSVVGRLITLVPFAALLVLPGCGGKGGTLSGKVLFKGNPVPGASITFLADNGQLRDATAEDDGTYKVTNVPKGRVRIGVKNFTQGMMDQQAKFMQEAAKGGGAKDSKGDIQQSMEGMMKNAGGKAGSGGFVQLPLKAIDPENSGISVEVTGGSQNFDIVVPADL